MRGPDPRRTYLAYKVAHVGHESEGHFMIPQDLAVVDMLLHRLKTVRHAVLNIAFVYGDRWVSG